MTLKDAKRSIGKQAILNYRGSYVCTILGVSNSNVLVEITGVRQVEILALWEGRTGAGFQIGYRKYVQPTTLYLSPKDKYKGATYKAALIRLRNYLWYIPFVGRAAAIARLNKTIESTLSIGGEK